jgi:hypothetical protein
VLVWLDHVEGVGSADGIAALSRRWAAESPSLERSSLDPSDLSAEQVFAAAAQGDPLGAEVIRRLGERFARISSAVGKVFDGVRLDPRGRRAGTAVARHPALSPRGSCPKWTVADCRPAVIAAMIRNTMARQIGCRSLEAAVP